MTAPTEVDNGLSDTQKRAQEKTVLKEADRGSGYESDNDDDDDDDDSDDLDDLDDVLDDFTPRAADIPKPAAPTAGSGIDETSTRDDEPAGLDQEAFERELRAQMEAVFKDLDANPEMQEELTALLGNISALGMDDKDGGSDSRPATAKGMASKPASGQTSKQASKPTSSTAKSATETSSFEDQILRAMNRMQESGEQASAAASQSSEDDLLLELLKSFDGSGSGGDASIASAISNIMGALLAKDILYEPMVELNQKFPVWLEQNGDKVSPEDRERYKVQRECVKSIVDRFERAGYSDDNADDKAFIQAQMDQMQNAGSPPADLVDEGAVQEMFQQTGGCPVQ